MSKIVFSGVGHGGNDNGAVANGLREDDMNLVEALACNEVLVAHGIKNPMSRYKDEADPIDEEVREANASGATIAIDWHNNAGGGDGFEAYYSKGDAEGLKLCRFIESEVIKLGQNSRGCKTKLGTDGKDYFAFIRNTKMTAIIIEGAFLDSKDRFFKDTKEEQKAYGVAVAKGILKYLGIPYKGTDKPQPKPSKPSKPQIKEEYDMKKIVTYLGDADLFAAVMVSQKLGCPLMRVNDFKASGLKAEQVIQIGGNVNDTNRFTTMKNATNKYL